MAQTIKGIKVVIGAETTGLSKALSEVNKKSKDMQTELKQVDKLLKLDPKNTELLAQKQELLGKAIQTTKEKLDTLKNAQSQVNEQFAKGEISEGQYRAFQRQLSETEQKLRDLEKTAGVAKKSLEEIGTAMQKSGEKLTSSGKTLSKNVTAPIVAFGLAAGTASIQFESAFAGVVKTVDATDEELAVLKQGIRDMAKEIPVAATEIANVAEAAGQLGIEVPNIMLFTRTMSDLGVSTNMPATQAAEALARLANITKMNQQDFDRLGSSIVALGNNFATTESDIVEMSLRLAGAGAQIGMSEADIMGLAAALSSVGIEAEMGGSALSRVMVRMQVAATTGLGSVKEMTDKTGLSLRELQLMASNAGMDFADLAQSLGMTKGELKSIVDAGVDLENFAAVAGMTAEQFTEKFKGDAVGALGEFINGLGNAEEAGDSAINMLQEMGITEIRLRDSLLRAGNASELFANAIDLSNEAWEENNALTQEAETRYGTTESKLKIMWNQIKDVAITLGDALIPALMDALNALKPLIDGIADLAKWFSNLNPATQKVVLAIAGIVVAIGPALIVVGKIVTAVGTLIKAFAAVKTAISAAGGVMTMLTGPVGLVIAAIAALATAAYLIIDNWEPISQFFSDLWDGIVQVTTDVWESIKNFFIDTWDWLQGFFAEWGAVILTVIAPFLGIPLLIYQYWDEIKEFLSQIWDAVATYLKNVWDNIKKAAGDAFQSMVNLVKPIIEGFKKFFQGIWEAIKNIFAGAILLIVDLVTGDFTKLKEDAEKIWNNLKDSFSKIWDGIKEIFFGTLDAIKTFISTTWDKVKENVTKAWNGIKTVINNLVTGILNWIKDEWNKMITFFKELPGKLYDIGSDMFNRMRDAVRNTVTGVKDAIVIGITAAIDWIKALPSQMLQFGKDIIQGLVNGIGSMVSKVKDKVKEVADSVTGTIRKMLGIQSPSKVMKEMGKWTGEGFAQGIDESGKMVEKSTEKVAKAVDTKFDATMKKIIKQADEAAKGSKKSTDKISKSFNEAFAAIASEKKLGNLDNSQYIKALEAIDKKYAKTAEQHRKVAEAISKTNKEMAKATAKEQEEAVKKNAEAEKKKQEQVRQTFEHSKRWIAERKDLNNLSLADELAAWERVQAKYTKGTDERTEADKNVLRVRKEIYNELTAASEDFYKKTTEINKNLEAEEKRLNDVYLKSVEDRTKAINNFAGLFDTVTFSVDKSGQELISGLESQINYLGIWSSEIDRLAARGIDEGLLEELRSMGPKAAPELAALNSLTDTELQKYSALWKIKSEESRRVATKELEGMRVDTQNQISKLRTEASDKMEEVRKEFDKKVKEIRTGTKDQFDGLITEMPEMGKSAVQGLIDGLTEMEGPLKDTAKRLADSVSATLQNALGISMNNASISASVDAVKTQTAKAVGSAAPKSQTVTSSKTLNFEGMFAGANFVVRSDNDTKAIAKELFAMIQQAERGAGG